MNKAIVFYEKNVESWLTAALCIYEEMHYLQAKKAPDVYFMNPMNTSRNKFLAVLVANELVHLIGELKFGSKFPTPFDTDINEGKATVYRIRRVGKDKLFPPYEINVDANGKLFDTFYNACPMLSYPIIKYAEMIDFADYALTNPLPPIIAATQAVFLFERGMVSSVDEDYKTLYNLLKKYIEAHEVPTADIVEDLFGLDSIKLYYWLRNKVDITDETGIIKIPDNVKVAPLGIIGDDEDSDASDIIPGRYNFATRKKTVVRKASDKKEPAEFKNPGINGKQLVANLNFDESGTVYESKNSAFKDARLIIYRVNLKGVYKYRQGECIPLLRYVKVALITGLPVTDDANLSKVPDKYFDYSDPDNDKIDFIIGIQNYDSWKLSVLAYSNIKDILVNAKNNDNVVSYSMFNKIKQVPMSFDVEVAVPHKGEYRFASINPKVKRRLILTTEDNFQTLTATIEVNPTQIKEEF